MVQANEIKIEWCENFIIKTFKKYRHQEYVKRYGEVGIECNLFWQLAEQSGLWVKGTYDSPMSKALTKLVRVESVQDKKGQFCYNVFKLNIQEERN